ncbi:MAG TPA: SMI1/KNR4 family protein [Actinocrinis sp.]|nr:SMI1/KNR4 family protein [Actinocrinis sp.]
MNEDEVFEAMRARAATAQWPAPASLESVEEAEKVIRHPIPPLLRRLYLEVANGGFGPGFGVMGVRGGRPGPLFTDIADVYQEGPDPTGVVPDGLVLLYDWGCAIWSVVDFRDQAGPMWEADNGQLFNENMNLTEWLSRSLDGTLPRLTQQ